MLPTENVGIVALTNASPVGVPEAVCRTFLDLALTGKIERDWLALFGKLFANAMAPAYGRDVDYSKPPEPPSAALAPAAYVGDYRNDLYRTVAIVTSDAGLSLALGPKRDSFALRHFDRDVFTYQPVGENAYGRSAVAFMIGADRKAASVRIENLDVDHQGTFRRA